MKREMFISKSIIANSHTHTHTSALVYSSVYSEWWLSLMTSVTETDVHLIDRRALTHTLSMYGRNENRWNNKEKIYNCSNVLFQMLIFLCVRVSICLFVCECTNFMLWTVYRCCWCCYCCCSGDTNATAYPCCLHSLQLFICLCLCIFEFRDILRACWQYTKRIHTNANDTDTDDTKTCTVHNTCIDYYFYVCMRPCFVSNMSSVVVRSASLICYIAIARSYSSSSSSFGFDMCVNVSCFFFHLLSVRIKNKTHQNYGNR